MIPSDRANPQVGGVDRRAGSIRDANLRRGLRFCSTVRFTFNLLPAPVGGGPQPRSRFGYSVGQQLQRAALAGPPGYSARIAAMRRVGE